MVRLALAILIIVSISWNGMGQTYYWTEEFVTSEGWTLEGNWDIEDGILQFSWDPTVYNFDHTAVSPSIALDENVKEFTINQSLLVYNPTEDETAQLIISSSQGDFILWDYSLANGNWGSSSGSDTTFSVEDFAGETIQLKIRTFGTTTFNWSYWQIFRITVIANYDYDLMLSAIQGPNKTDVQQSADWVVEVQNRGSEEIPGFIINLLDSKSGQVVDMVTETNPIQPGESNVYGFSWTPNTAYNTLIYGEVDAGPDQFSGNDLSEGLFLRIEPEINYSILVWDNDNGIQSIVCPEEGDLITPITGLTRALDDAGLDYDLTTLLPVNLDDYDIVIATMGNYCLS